MTSGGCPSPSCAISVLFVDDDVDTLFAYKSLATDHGLVVDIAEDGPTAIARADLIVPDVIVLDIGLRGIDGLDGFEVARRLRAGAKTSAIPIVIVSGYDSDRDRAQVKASGCEGHLVKPCSAEVLFELVTKLAAHPRYQADVCGPHADPLCA